MTRPVHVLITGLATSTLVLTAYGCGDGLKARYPVYGKVTYKGQMVPKGRSRCAARRRGRGGLRRPRRRLLHPDDPYHR